MVTGSLLLAKAATILTASVTSYCPGSSGDVTADGSHVRWGIAASNRHRFGTRIRLIGVRFRGRRTFTVVAARRTGRRGIGVELSQHHAATAAQRVIDETLQLDLLGEEAA